MMDTKKKLLFSAAVFLTLALTVAAVIFGVNRHIYSLASVEVATETVRITVENEQLKTRRDILAGDVGAKTDDTERKDALNKEIAEITGEISTMKSDLATAEKATGEVKTRTAALKKTLTALQNGMNPKSGRAVSVGERGLQCPASINPGRYIAAGDGIVTIIAANGAARVSEDLLTIDTGTYTFDLADGEAVEADSGNVTLTELK